MIVKLTFCVLVDRYIPSENMSDEKTLIFVGTEGAERNTFINALINHVLEVSYSDNHRFALIDHTTGQEIDQVVFMCNILTAIFQFC